MANQLTPERMFFTFRSNGGANGKDLVEATVEKLDEHEPPANNRADKQSWFGTTEELGALLDALGFAATDIAGILSTIRVNKVVTRDFETHKDALETAGFAPAA